MKKRSNPKVESMRERSLMLESERQNYERKYSLNEQVGRETYYKVVSAIKSDSEKAKKWVEETNDDNMIYMLIDNVKYGKDMEKNADYYNKRLEGDMETTQDFLEYMKRGKAYLGGFPSETGLD